ncbi:MAG TPA: M28 family peptidase [Pirellulales bacterium]|jgi:Zn-dependent M28 family amino/carboxypeptidase|nr:M28 family peptidase [Pirellulales bacterium]
MPPSLKFSQPNSKPSNLQIDADYLRQIVKKLAFPRVVNSPANATARQIILEEFAKLPGPPPAVYGSLSNVYSGVPETSTVLLGAHYDSVPGSPGADDNASAVAVMLAAARAIAGHANVLYVAFNSEEYGLAGSREFAAALPRLRCKPAAVYILEMVGYRDRRPHSQRNPLPMYPNVPTTGDFLGVVTNQDALLGNILAGAATCSVPFVGLSLPEVMHNLAAVQSYSPHLLRSDHTSFWERGIPAAMLTDTAEFRSPHYHHPSDTPDTLDYDFMAEVTKAVVNMIVT